MTRSTQLIKWLLPFVAVAPMIASAQFTNGGGQARKPAWEEFKLDPNKTVQLSFKNASPDSVIELISRVSGITIVKDPAFKDKITVSSPKAVKLKEAFEIFDASIGLLNYEMAKQNNLIVIRKKQQRQDNQMTPEQIQQMMQGFGQGDASIKVYFVKYANASEVARVVNEVFENQDSQNPLAMLFGGFAGGGQGGRNQRGGNRGGGFGGFGQSSAPTVRASSDDYSNSVIVNAPAKKQLEVEDLISKIDKQTDAPQTTRVYELEYAVATEVAVSVQNVLTSNAPTGRGGGGQQNVPIQQRFQQAARFGNAQSAFGTVVADARTNSLVVTATEENHKVVEAVIDQLDKDVPIESTTFFFPLSNARADDIASLLNQAFGGGRTGNNNANRTGTNTGNRTNTQGRTGGGGGGGNTLGGGLQGRGTDDPNSLDLPVDPVTGELLTNVEVAQFFGGGGGQQFRVGGGQNGGGNNSNTTTQLQRGADGRLVNTRNLSNQITVIPDQNTNGLIIVTSPENVELIQQILDQLDKIPEQVMIQTMIVEATLDKTDKLGVEWNAVMPKIFGTDSTGQATTDFNVGAAADGFRYTIAGGNLTGLINALKTDDKFEVLSTPRIFTSNNVQAEINISQSVPYILSTREDVNGNQTFNYDFQDVGIVLTVTPRITSNGMVTLDVVQTANDLQGFTDFNAPIVNKRQAETTVSVRDGETIVLGGIMRSTVTANVKKLPILGDIPILGELFKSRSKTTSKTELMVFLTPRVVRDPEEARRLREDTEQSLSPGVQTRLKGAQSKGNTTGSSVKGSKGNRGN
jgi:general secretion pathway protein D